MTYDSANHLINKIHDIALSIAGSRLVALARLSTEQDTCCMISSTHSTSTIVIKYDPEDTESNIINSYCHELAHSLTINFDQYHVLSKKIMSSKYHQALDYHFETCSESAVLMMIAFIETAIKSKLRQRINK